MTMVEVFFSLAALFSGAALVSAVRRFTRKVEDEGKPLDQAYRETMDEM